MAEIRRQIIPFDTGVLNVYKKVGDEIKASDILMDLEEYKHGLKPMPYTAQFEGTLLYIAQAGKRLFKNGIIAIIGNTGEDIQSILDEEIGLPFTSYEYHFNKFKYEGFCSEVEIYKIHKEDGDYVRKGDVIFTLFDLDEKYVEEIADRDGYLDFELSFDGNLSQVYYHMGEVKIIKGPNGEITLPNGEINIIHGPKRENKFVEEPISIYHDDLLYYIHANEQDRLNRKFVNEAVTTSDPFTKEKNIQYSCGLAGFLPEFIITPSLNKKIFLCFSFANIGGKDYIVFRTNPLELTLLKDDVVSFLFENEQIIEFKLSHESYKVDYPNPKDGYWSISKILITDNELMIFQNVNFKYWKVFLNKKNHSIIGGDVGFKHYFSKKNLITVVKKYTTEYRELVRQEIENYKPLYDPAIVENKAIIYEECYVYLMIDYTNSHHKIGISNNPDFREKTLQSEKPTIKMLAAKKFVNRKIASSFEKALHNTYSKKRIRGEWFQLDTTEINEIKITLQD